MLQQKIHRKSTMLRRGIALILAPFIVGIATFLVLAEFGRENKQVLANECLEADVNMRLNQVIESWNGLSDRYFWRTVGAPKSKLLSPTPYLAKIDAELRDIDRLCSGMQATHHFTQQIREMVIREGELYKFLDNTDLQLYELNNNTEVPPWQLVSNARAILKATTTFTNLKGEEEQAIEANWQELKSSQQARDNELKAFQLLVGVLLFANIVFSLILTRLVALGISVRMKDLVTSSEKFLQGHFDSAKLKGDDEFTFLQNVIHHSFEKVTNAHQHRQMILAMVAHDVRAPLTSAKANLHLMEEYANGLPEPALNLLLEIYDKLDLVLQAAEEILSEKSNHFRMPLIGEKSNNVLERHRSKIFKPRVKLFQQLLAMTLVPLTVQVVFLGVIYIQAQHASSIARVARRYIDLLHQKNLMLIDTLRAIDSQYIFFITKQKPYNTAAISQFDQASQRAYILSKLASEENSLAYKYAALFKLEVEQTRNLVLAPELAKQRVTERFASLIKIGEFHERSPIALSSRRLEQQWRKADLEKVDSASVQMQVAASRLLVLICYGLVFHICIEFLILLYFIYSIRTSVNTLTDAAGKVGQRTFVKVQFSSGDSAEVAELGDALNTANLALDRGTELRKELLSYLSNQMQLPLVEAFDDEEKLRALVKDTFSAKCLDYLLTSQRSITRVVDLLDDMLALEELEAGSIDLKIDHVEVSNLLEQCVRESDALAQVKEIKIRFESDHGFVAVDARKIRRAVTNLLTNAIKFSPHKSVVILKVAVDAATLYIEVIDRGPGIRPEEQLLIFEPKFQSQGSESEGSHGLGLAICKLIVESHKGQIGVRSIAPNGSTFWITIPMPRTAN